MGTRDEVLRANAAFADSYPHADLPRPPARSLAIVTCIDGRIDPLQALGLEAGDANVLRNAGARITDDMLRSLVVSRWLLGMRETMVIGHTDCGLEGASNDEIRTLLPLPTELDFLPFSDVDEAVREGVRRIAESPLLPGVEASGWVFDVRTGGLRAVT